jgi:hypothetical protein
MSRDPLGVLARLRAIEEQRAQAAAARAQLAAQAAEHTAASARDAYAARPQPDLALTPVALRALQLQGTGALEVLQEALLARDEADHARRGAQDALSMATARRKSVERLTQRRMVEASRAAQAAAQRSLDELVLLGRAQCQP